jgi:indolepyruvate ferredoxin oxidoreductase
MAEDPSRLPQRDQPRRSLDEMTLPEIVAHRRGHLTAYQNGRLADRYAALVARVEEGTRGLSDAVMRDRILRAVATGYSRLLSQKDEYEVARLLTAPEFRKGLEDAFEGDVRISLNLAPPGLSKAGPNGERPPKREFGPRIFPALRALAKMRHLRGTVLDPFGRTAERRAERALIRQFEGDMDRVLSRVGDHNAATALALLDLANQIRGYGPVKASAIEEVAKKRAKLIEEMERPQEPPHRMAAE